MRINEIFVRLTIGLLATLVLLSASCVGDADDRSSDPVSMVRIRVGEKVNGECVFDDYIEGYPVAYSGVSEYCSQAVSIGPLRLSELEQLKREIPQFWEESYPYREMLVGDWIDGKCQFTNPAVQAYLEFSETVSTDWTRCTMLVDVGPVTENQIEEVERHGSRSSETPVPASPDPVPGQR